MIHPLGLPSTPIDLLRPLHYGGQRATPLGYHRLERERIHLLLIDDAKRGLADIEPGRTCGADAAIAQLQHRRAASTTGKATKKRG